MRASCTWWPARSYRQGPNSLLLCSVLVGYTPARQRFPDSNLLGVGIFLAHLVPDTLLFLPLAEVIAALGLYDTYLGAHPDLPNPPDPVRLLSCRPAP